MRLRTVGLILTLALGTVMAPLVADAQKPSTMPRIGWLSVGSPTDPTTRPLREAFRQGLRDLGWVEGQNVAIEYRFAHWKFERLPELAAELVRLKVDLILAGGTPAIQAAKQATKTISIVMGATGDPVGTGFVASLARPGGNITGLSILAPDLDGKRLQLLKEVVPGISRVAVLWDPSNPYAPLVLKETEVAARALGVQLQILNVAGPAELDGAFSAMARERADGLIVTPDPMLYASRREIIGLAAKHRLPAISPWREYAEAGGLVAYGPSIPDLYRRAATYADKILKGANPADLPVEQPTRFELVVNLKAAQALGLTIPHSILLRADQLIQ